MLLANQLASCSAFFLLLLIFLVPDVFVVGCPWFGLFLLFVVGPVADNLLPSCHPNPDLDCSPLSPFSFSLSPLHSLTL